MSGMSDPQPEPGSASRDADREPTQVTYGQHYYEHDCGTPYERNDHWTDFFAGIADRIVKELKPRSVLDAGCAMGLLVEQLFRRGVDAWGVDISKYAITQVHESVADRCRVGSLVDPLDQRYDLVVCIEVVEHMRSDDARAAIANLCAASDRVLFSSSPFDYAEPTHLNVQPPEYWSAAFAGHGFFRNLDHDASYIAPWSVLYERRSADPRDLVRNYDRSYWRLSNEVAQLRTSLVQLHEQLERVVGDRENPMMQQQLEEREGTILELRERILHMRDMIIGLEAANGEIAGQRDMYFGQLAARNAAVDQLQAILESRTWRTAWKLMSPYRRMRRRGGVN
jgi:SAM-dependent methyltransferase